MACLAVATFALFAIDEPRSKSCSNNQGGAPPRQTTKANSNPNHETDWMNRLADAKREIAIDLLWVKVGAKEVVPNWKKHRKLRL